MPLFIHERVTAGLCSWCWVLVFTPSTAVLVGKLKFMMTVINKEFTYSQGTDNISSFLNNSMQEHLESTPLFL
jgi:hypothetical protein